MAFLTNQRYEPYKEQTQNRASMSSRISRLFSRRRDDDGSAEQSVVTSSGCEVPIFMSTPAEAPQSSSRRPQFGEIGASWTEPAIIPEERRHTIPCSSVYSESPRPDHNHHEYEAEEDSPRSPACVHDLEEGSVIISTTSSQAPVLREKRRKARRPRESLRQRIAGKKRLSVAFGVTTLATVTTYVVLAATHIASGLMFHILCILFILGLVGVFLHSSISTMMLQKRRRARQARHRDWHGSSGRSSSTSSESNLTSNDHTRAMMSEKPIEIREGAEEIVTVTPRGRNKRVIRQPPPVYGSFRGSKRMNPELVFWHKQNPSPTTPTYDEAMNDVQTAVGYQPPVYTSPLRVRTGQEGERTSNIHPLERERLCGLMGNTMVSRHN